MLDTWKNQKGLLANFVVWVQREHGGTLPAEPALVDALLEQFLPTQGFSERHIPACRHCGDAAHLTTGDLSSERIVSGEALTLLRKTNPEWSERRLHDTARILASPSKGPAWICETCGTYTPKEPEGSEP